MKKQTKRKGQNNKKGLTIPVLALCLVGILLSLGNGSTEVTGEPGSGTYAAAFAEGSDSPDTDATLMEVHFLDIGQGDSTLIINGEHAMLIDAGDNDKGSTIWMYLQKRGIEKLDYLILTHTDADHIGGADVIVEKLQVDTVFMGDFQKDNATYRDLMQALDYKSLTFSTPRVGSVYTLGDASFTIVAPNGEYDTPNDSSIGLRLVRGETSFLFTGDAEEQAEADMLANGLTLDADVYQVGHHGSRSSSDREFLEAVSPAYAVISCAEGNSYGHPHARTLNNLRALGVQVFRTDEQGSIVVSTDGKELTWNCAPSDTWQVGEQTQAEKDTQGSTQSSIQEGTQGSTQSSTQGSTQSSTQGSIQEGTQGSTRGITYICNTDTKKFHYPSCSSVGQMADKNKLESAESRDEIIAEGYEACKRCNP